MDGKPWQSIGAKAKTLPGSAASWPVGLADLATPGRTAVIIVEGGPDLIAAYDLILSAGLPVEKITVCAMLGAAQNIAPEALDLLARQPVWILPQGDRAGNNAVDRWAKAIVEKGGQAPWVIRVANFGYTLPDGSPVKDLNDLCLAPDLNGSPWILRTCRTLCKHLNVNHYPREGARNESL